MTKAKRCAMKASYLFIFIHAFTLALLLLSSSSLFSQWEAESSLFAFSWTQLYVFVEPLQLSASSNSAFRDVSEPPINRSFCVIGDEARLALMTWTRAPVLPCANETVLLIRRHWSEVKRWLFKYFAFILPGWLKLTLICVIREWWLSGLSLKQSAWGLIRWNGSLSNTSAPPQPLDQYVIVGYLISAPTNYLY